MDPKVRRLTFYAGALGGLLGALIGVVSRGTSYSDTIGAALGVVAGFAAALYWSEHGGARRRLPRRTNRPQRVPHPRHGQFVSGRSTNRDL